MRRVFFFILFASLVLVAASAPLGCGEAAPPRTEPASPQTQPAASRTEPSPSQTEPATSPTEPRSPPYGGTVTSAEREALLIPDVRTLEELGQMVLSGFSRRSYGPGVFDTHVDWHSSVHAHWALLRVAVQTSNARLRNLVVERLRSADLAREQVLLEQRDSFEMPYGRAWLLRLVIEYEAATGDSLMRPLGDSVARSLEEYISERSNSAGLPEYGNLEWAATALFDYGQASDSEHFRESGKALGEALLAAGGAIDWSEELRSDIGFFSIAGNTALLISAITSGGRSDEYSKLVTVGADDTIEVPPARASAHSVGLFFSRAWGLKAAYLLTGDRAFETAYYDHMEVGLGELRRRSSDFQGVGHWVPQFAIYALTLGG